MTRNEVLKLLHESTQALGVETWCVDALQHAARRGPCRIRSVKLAMRIGDSSESSGPGLGRPSGQHICSPPKRGAMTADDYLEQLQANYRRYDYLLEILRKRRELIFKSVSGSLEAGSTLEQMPVSKQPRELEVPAGLLEDVAAAFEQLVEGSVGRRRVVDPQPRGWLETAHDEFQERAPDEASQAFGGGNDVAVGLLASASFNASAIPVPGATRSWVIAMNNGISQLVYEVARVVAQTLNVTADHTGGSTEPLSNERAAGALFERLNNYVHLGVAFGTDSPASFHQKFLASSATTMAERFAYLHEVSHILLRHHDHCEHRLLPDDWSAAQQVVHAPEQEHEADSKAWQLLSKAFVRSPAELQLAYAGVCLLMTVADILERASDSVAVGTHPPALVRLSRLQEAVDRESRAAGLPFDRVADIQRALCDRLQQIMVLAPSLPGVSPLQALLDDASSAAIPDYMSFQDQVLAMLCHGAPTKLCKALGVASAQAERQLSRFSAKASAVPDRETLRATRQAMNKWKLVNGLVGLYLVPDIAKLIDRHRLDSLRRQDD